MQTLGLGQETVVGLPWKKAVLVAISISLNVLRCYTYQNISWTVF